MISLSCYNHADRVKSVTLYHDNDAARVLAVNDYDPLGRLAKAHLPGETVTYTYNIRNALTSISSPRFAQTLRYAAGAQTPCYNGNIAEIITEGNRYAYRYDHANRLTEAKYTPSVTNSTADYSASYSYDLNSNITALTRYGQKMLIKYGIVDDLTMTYDGNQLTNIDDDADEVLLEHSFDVKSPSVTLRPVDFPLPPFSYDANGNTTRDQSRNLYSISYNALNLPECILVSSSSSSKLQSTIGTPSISYRYDGGGVKHEVVHSRFESIATGLGGTLKVARHDTTRYVGSHIYENGRLDRILTPYGYLKDGVHHTYLHDYQGNVVAVVAGDSLVQQTSYYPYGLPHAKSTNATANRYKYGGKELDTFGGINLADFHARQSDLSGRFLTVDPLSEDYYGYSIYLYCLGNPIANTDPTGMEVIADEEMQEAIRNTLSKSENDYVSFDENGVLNNDLINQLSPSSNNFASLQTLSNSELKYICSVDTKTSNGEDLYFDNEIGQGRRGVTEIPDNVENPSPDNNVHIKVYKELDALNKATTTSHEMYGHAYIYEQSRNPAQASHDYHNVEGATFYDSEFKVYGTISYSKDLNTFLDMTIKRTINETKRNYENWYK